jgi:bifunctional non-homologous end joining protein LigD
MAERWKPLPASGYKEDFRLRKPALPPTYTTTPARVVRRRHKALPPSRSKFTNVEKILWPEEGYRKADVIAYYDAIRDVILPHLAGRPLIMERYPDGIAAEYFLQKDALTAHTPDWLIPHVHEVYAPEDRRTVRYIVANHPDVLLYLANYAAITLHPWSSRLGSLDSPDHVLFDLDPVDAPFAVAQAVALELKRVLDELGLRAYPKTSGATGLHVYLPVLEGSVTYPDGAMFSAGIAKIVAQRIPEAATITRSLRKREKGKVYVDSLQNGRGKTLAGVYSLRARPMAPVSAPLKWTELKKPIDPAKFNIETLPKRIKTVGDLFAPVLTDKQDIRHLVQALRGSRGFV